MPGQRLICTTLTTKTWRWFLRKSSWNWASHTANLLILGAIRIFLCLPGTIFCTRRSCLLSLCCVLRLCVHRSFNSIWRVESTNLTTKRYWTSPKRAAFSRFRTRKRAQFRALSSLTSARRFCSRFRTVLLRCCRRFLWPISSSPNALFYGLCPGIVSPISLTWILKRLKYNAISIVKLSQIW